MAMLSLLCRLKILSPMYVASLNELSRSSLIETSVEANRPPLLLSRSLIVILDQTKRSIFTGHCCRGTNDWPVYLARDISRYESWRRKLLNGEKNIFDDASSANVYMDTRERCTETKKNVGTLLLDRVSSNTSQHTLATSSDDDIYRIWKFSKEPCPSTRYFGLSIRNLSNSTSRLYTLADNSAYGKFSSLEKSEKILRKMVRYENVRSYSSSKDAPCNKMSKSEECSNEEEQEDFEDVCSKSKPEPCELKSSIDECPDSSRPCKPFSDDPEPVCVTPPCPNIEDYCPKEGLHEERFWKMVVCFIALPLIIAASGFVYSREMEKKKQPRPEFVDVPWMRKIVKPFPWGDGKHTFFHNPVRNPISPQGYEVEDPNAVKTGKTKD